MYRDQQIDTSRWGTSGRTRQDGIYYVVTVAGQLCVFIEAAADGPLFETHRNGEQIKTSQFVKRNTVEMVKRKIISCLAWNIPRMPICFDLCDGLSDVDRTAGFTVGRRDTVVGIENKIKTWDTVSSPSINDVLDPFSN